MEDSRNIRCVCPEHSPKPGAFKGDPKTLIGKFVKRAFTNDKEQVEHMWVRVLAVTDDGVVQGVLDNDPTRDMGVVCGDAVTVQLNDIEEVLD